MERNSDFGRSDPRWVDAILDWPWTWLVARIGLTAAFIVGALTKLADLHSAALEQERVGLHPGLTWALLTIAVEITGPILVISGRYVWLGAGMLGIFTGLANLYHVTASRVRISYFNPITIESGPTSGSTRVFENPTSRIQA